MKLRESRHRQVDVFHLEGEIDLDHAPTLRGLFQAKAADRCPALVVDLSAVPMIDSTGISVLLEYLRDASEFGGRFGFAGPTSHVRTVFEMIRLDTVIPIFQSVAEATEVLAGAAGAGSRSLLDRAAATGTAESLPASRVA